MKGKYGVTVCGGCGEAGPETVDAQGQDMCFVCHGEDVARSAAYVQATLKGVLVRKPDGEYESTPEALARFPELFPTPPGPDWCPPSHEEWNTACDCLRCRRERE